MTGTTTMARIYIEDAKRLNQLRHELSAQGQEVTIADVVHALLAGKLTDAKRTEPQTQEAEA